MCCVGMSKRAVEREHSPAVWETLAHHLLWPAQSGLGKSAWARILASAVCFSAAGPGGMTVGMTAATDSQGFLDSGRAACLEPLRRFSQVAEVTGGS
jgi:hypothetical protein